ncbi:MAG: CD225/dispanin family protein [Elusimicrobiaceae bacterium]|nr:CD225/dispanin family protein [Elusimicrobiaceae bacterium]MBP5616362.1 CD225/dispanin family protein [Elusimicrobiaceae bacterium]
MNEHNLNTHFVLVVIALIISCLAGFWTIPLALAALVFSLRASDLIYQERLDEAKKAAWWAGLFSWLTIGIAVIPIILIILFGGTILALLGAALAAAA